MESPDARVPATFEEAYEALRRAVDELELGPLPLETAIARYEEGIRLAQLCNDILDRAEIRLRRVRSDED